MLILKNMNLFMFGIIAVLRIITVLRILHVMGRNCVDSHVKHVYVVVVAYDACYDVPYRFRITVYLSVYVD